MSSSRFPKQAVCGVNVGFKCATGGVEHDKVLKVVLGIQMGYQKLMVLGVHNCNTGTSTLPITTVLEELK